MSALEKLRMHLVGCYRYRNGCLCDTGHRRLDALSIERGWRKSEEAKR